MSAADAWEAWTRERNEMDPEVRAHEVGYQRHFNEGYRRALEDAADAIQALHPGEVKASVTFIRELAAAVAPRETKD